MERRTGKRCTKELDVYIYDYLMKRNLVTTAKSFMEESQFRESWDGLKGIDIPGGLLSEWWSIFWEHFVSITDPVSHTDGHALELKQLQMGHQYIQEDEQMEQSDAIQNAILKYKTHQSNMLVFASSGQDATKNTLHGMDKGISGPSSQAQKLEVQPQPCQPNKQQIVFGDILVREDSVDGPIQSNSPQDGKGAAESLDLSEDVSAQKTTGIVFEELRTLKVSSKKLFCCDFSSDGNLLASAGDENKVFIWNISDSLENHTWEAHSSFITDISFRHNDTILATASSDKTVRLWDASQSGNGIQTFVGHNSSVRSVDFHGQEPSLLCSSDDGGMVFFWTMGQPNPRVSQVTGRGKVRFHPGGQCVAASIGNTVNIIHVETDERIQSLQGSSNNKFIQSLCWSEYGKLLATLSEDCVQLWSLGECIRELSGKQFRSCSFHQTSPDTLVIGGYQTVTLWNFTENKTMSVQPHSHSFYVSDLATSYSTRIVASASHDGSLKIWR